MSFVGLDVLIAALYERDIPRPTVCPRRNLGEVARLWRSLLPEASSSIDSTSLNFGASSQPSFCHSEAISEVFYRHGLGAEGAAIGNAETLRLAFKRCTSGSLVTCMRDGYPPAWARNSGVGYPVLQIRESRPPQGYQSILKAESIARSLFNSSRRAFGEWAASQASLSNAPSVTSNAPSLASFDETFSKPFLAVVGSRQIDSERKELIRLVVQAAASRGASICSGGAPGTDRAAIDEAARHTSSFELWPCGLDQRWGIEGEWGQRRDPERLSKPTEGHDFFVEPEGDLPICHLPLIGSFVACSEPFDRRHAMERNAALYAMAEAAFVAHARFKEGGSWHGAVTALRRRLCRVIVPMDGSPAHRALVSLGAIPFDLSLPVPIALEKALAAEPLQPWLAFQVPSPSRIDGLPSLFQ